MGFLACRCMCIIQFRFDATGGKQELRRYSGNAYAARVADNPASR